MKSEIRKETTVQERVVYIAEDGREFDSANECTKYEDNLYCMKHPVLATVKKVTDLDSVVATNGSYTRKSCLYYVRNKDDLEILKGRWDNPRIKRQLDEICEVLPAFCYYTVTDDDGYYEENFVDFATFVAERQWAFREWYAEATAAMQSFSNT